MRNTIRGRRIEARRFEFVMMATILAGFWSLMSGTVVVVAFRAFSQLSPDDRAWYRRLEGDMHADLRTRRTSPELPADGRYWVAETAVLIGRVRLKQDASVVVRLGAAR